MTQKIVMLLNDIQKVMSKVGAWQTIPPAPEKLMSVEPFSIDTLSFVEWLQWIYIARLRAIIDAGGQLPSGAQVYPYAVEALKGDTSSIPGLLNLIQQLDEAMA